MIRGKTVLKDNSSNILPVLRSKKEAEEVYNRISRFYDYTEGIFERKHINMALGQLGLKKGEKVLEIGFGTGYALIKIAEYIGEKGNISGIDISTKMLEKADKRIKRKSLSDRVKLICGDGIELPYPDNSFNAVFLSFTLELFDTPEIPEILKEIKRVLKPGGRIGVASLSKEGKASLFVKIYEWAHIKFPKYIDCRPIYVAQSIKDAGFNIRYLKISKIFFAPLETVIGTNE